MNFHITPQTGAQPDKTIGVWGDQFGFRPHDQPHHETTDISFKNNEYFNKNAVDDKI